jgi:hypothetical protein
MSVATLQLGRPMDAPTARVIAHPAMSYSDTLASGSLTTATYAERAHGYEPMREDAIGVREGRGQAG